MSWTGLLLRSSTRCTHLQLAATLLLGVCSETHDGLASRALGLKCQSQLFNDIVVRDLVFIVGFVLWVRLVNVPGNAAPMATAAEVHEGPVSGSWSS